MRSSGLLLGIGFDDGRVAVRAEVLSYRPPVGTPMTVPLVALVSGDG